MIWSYGASDTLDSAARISVYQHKINFVTGGSHDNGGSSVIHGSIAIILLCAALYAFH